MAIIIKVSKTDDEVLDNIKHGWLRVYLLPLDAMFTKRWDYWLRTLEAGKVLDEPIPQIRWSEQGHIDATKNLQACMDCCRNHFALEAFNMFVQWLLFGFGDPSVKELPRGLESATSIAWYKTFNMDLYLQHPYDYLGCHACEIYGSGRHNPTSYFPTPMNVSVMMAAMTMSDADKNASVCDPCVGSGRLLMAASNYSLNLYGMDIDYSILNVCKVNMWLYVPWALGRPNIDGLESAYQPTEHGDALVPRPIQQVTPEVQKQLIEGGQQMNLF